ncbi:Thioredoxin domain protein [Geobacter metallireducens RCH3]|uniref:Thioredoxin domain protein n=1 Tax=Geobacter metallireducens (strain ATCC 53774 / DSM 7210 / GS-15) TaxID=269799 RepID=Q39SA4_GEOMG|nr:thioredoxin domain-containing protein [Geobacter metallireducens]ABB32870.1 thioredoxin domain protein [Geobacter metallireducens GS-15]EHP88996.1 Thioredoxin domain protein [Geobacter metallireducens RCH3]
MKKTLPQLVIMSVLCLLAALPALAQEEIPAAAKERFKAGLALIEKADKSADFLAALAEFEAAAALAPTWPDSHYNLAQLAAESDKPAKAIKEYRAYLALKPDAADRGAVEAEMARMKELIALKRKVGLPGVTFAAMADGIWVLQVLPGAGIEKTGLRKGHQIVGVGGKPLAGNKLEDLFKAIEANNITDTMSRGSSERMYSRMTRDTKTQGPVVVLNVKQSRQQEKPFLILCKKEMFRSKIIEIEEDEFEDEVLKAPLPVAVTFWGDSCEPCKEFVPVLEAESAKYAGKVKFVNINVDGNRKLADQLAVKEVPALMVYKGGSAVATATGKLPREKVAEMLQDAAGR